MADHTSSDATPSPDIKRRQIDNPLRHYTLPQLDKIATAFAEKILADPELFVRAARLARDPPNFGTIPGITREETIALEREKTDGFLHQPKTLKTTIVTLVFSALTHGWIQSVGNGANQTMPEYFGFKSDCGSHAWRSQDAIWKFAAINSITYLTAGVFGCWISDPLQSRLLGRRGAILISACICIMGAIGAASATKWWQELIWRWVLGIGLGAKASVTPIFGAEVSPSHLRGVLVMNWQLFVALGIFLGFSANLVFYWTGDLAWRFQIASACIPSGALLCLIPTIPESPRWLLKAGKVSESFQALCMLRPTPLQAAAELFYAHAQIQMEVDYMHPAQTSIDSEKQTNGVAVHHEEDNDKLLDLRYYKTAVGQTHYWTRIIQLFRNDRVRRATKAATVVMLGQQLSGVNVLAFYSTVFFQDINQHTSKGLQALWLSWGLGLANFIFTIPAYWGIERLGRRSLLLVTYPGMILSMLGASMSFLGGTDDERNVRVGVFMFLFIIWYSLGQGPVAFAYSSEVFPLFNREAGMSWAVFINLFFAGVLTLIVPQAQVSTSSTIVGDAATQDVTLQQSITDNCNATNLQDILVIFRDAQNGGSNWTDIQAKLLGAFVGFGILSFILIFLFVPETKLAAGQERGNRSINYISLEELNHIFKVYTWDFIVWQFTEVLPYELEIMKFLLFIRKEKPESLPPMHRWAADRRDESEDEARETGETESATAHTESHDDLERTDSPGRNDSSSLSQHEGTHLDDEIIPVRDSEDETSGQLNPTHQRSQMSEVRRGDASTDDEAGTATRPLPHIRRKPLPATKGVGPESVDVN